MDERPFAQPSAHQAPQPSASDGEVDTHSTEMDLQLTPRDAAPVEGGARGEPHVCINQTAHNTS